MLFVPLYWVLAELGLDDGPLLVLAPRLLQAIFAAATDTTVAYLAGRLLGKQYTLAALFCSLSSFFNFHASTRTLSNSIETSLTSMAIASWPWPVRNKSNGHPKSRQSQPSSLPLALTLAAIACIMRPSNAIIWITLGVQLLARHPPRPEGVYIVSVTFFIGVSASLLCFLLDTLFYSTPTFTPIRFLHENILHSISLFYGSNSNLFYVTQGIPVMTMTQLPFLVHGLWIVFARSDERGKGLRPLGWVALITVVMFSLLGHKEWRFLYPILPIFHLFVAFSLVTLSCSHLRIPTKLSRSISSSLGIRWRYVLFVVLSLAPALYFACFHSIAQVAVMDYLRDLSREDVRSIAFLMPCHSTPWQSHLHRRDLELGGLRSGEGGNLWFLTCEPPIGQSNRSYRDQSDYFYSSPSTYILTRFPPRVDPSFPPSPFSSRDWKHTWPSHLIFFQALLDQDPKVENILRERGYEEVERRWNSVWHDDERRRGDVVVWKWEPDISM